MAYLVHPIIDIVYQQLKNFTSLDKFCMALSGGIDSITLLHILLQIKKNHQFNLEAIHINDNVAKNAGKLQQHCSNICITQNISLTTYTEDIIKKGGQSLENLSRNIRLKQYYNVSSNIIILAHHRVDQAETILSQIFRGSNLHNVAAMKNISKRQNKIFWRPLLNISKEQINEYANTFGLKYIDDETNLDTKHLRNFVRHKILPDLRERDSNIETKINNLAKQIQEVMLFVDEITESDYNLIIDSNHKIKADLFIKLTAKRQFNVICLLIKKSNLPLPSNKQIVEFCRQTSLCNIDKNPKLHLSQAHILIKDKTNIVICM